MAFDLTKPSATATNFAAAFGDIRENFRAIVQGDANVFSALRVDGNAAIGGAPSGNRRLQVIAASPSTDQPGTSAAGIRIVNSTAAVGGEKAEISFGTIDLGRVYGAISGWLTDASNNSRGDIIFSTRGVTTDANLTERMRLDGAGNVGIGASAPSGNRLYVKGESSDTTKNGLTVVNAAGTVVAQFRNDAFIRFGAATPSVRLHIGVGGTGTQAEQVYIDAGSGAGGQPSLHFLRNTLLRATVGIVATASSLITGSSVNDLAIINNGSILFSVDAGTTLHAFIDTSGRFRAKALMTDGATPSVGPGIIAFGTTTATTVGAAGGASAQPATPVGYLVINIAGTNYKIPYHNN